MFNFDELPLTLSINQTSEIGGWSRNTTLRLISANKLEAKKILSSTRIVTASLRKLLKDAPPAVINNA